jgi:hypothetical protein
MLSPTSGQVVSQQHPTTTTRASNVDWRVRATYHDLLSLPVSERFIDLVQSHPEQPQAHTGNEEARQLCPATT